jgi:hypothetical protein
MRFPRVKANGHGFYHCVSRVVEGRFIKSVLLEGGEAVAAVAAYIELNPVRAGLCADPKDYRYCGYAEALAKGCPLARQGIATILGQPETVSWKELSGPVSQIPLCDRELRERKQTARL